MYVFCSSVVLVLWVVAAYMKLVVVSAKHMKLGAVSVLYARLDVQLLIFILTFADCSFDRSLTLIIQSSPGHKLF
jgi:hypothetical protein